VNKLELETTDALINLLHGCYIFWTQFSRKRKYIRFCQVGSLICFNSKKCVFKSRLVTKSECLKQGNDRFIIQPTVNLAKFWTLTNSRGDS